MRWLLRVCSTCVWHSRPNLIREVVPIVSIWSCPSAILRCRGVNSTSPLKTTIPAWQSASIYITISRNHPSYIATSIKRHHQSKFLLLLKATNCSKRITPSPSGSHCVIISLISAGVTSSFNSSAAAMRSSSEMKPLLSSSKFWKMRSMSSSVSLWQGRWVINFTNSLKVISPPSSASKTDMATYTNGRPGLQPPYSRMALRRSMGVSIPSQSSSRQSKTCLKTYTSRREHSATMYSLGSKLMFFFPRKLERCPPFSGVLAFYQRQLPRPLPYCWGSNRWELIIIFSDAIKLQRIYSSCIVIIVQSSKLQLRRYSLIIQLSIDGIRIVC